MTAPQDTAAAGASAAAVAANARAAQLAVRANLMRDVVTLWPLLDKNRLDQSWPGWLRAMSLLIKNYRSQSSVAAGAGYRLQRAAFTQSPAPQSLVKLAPDPDPEWLRKALGYAGPGTLDRDTAKPGTALSTTLGTASRIVLDAGRTTVIDTVDADPVAVGWYRLTDGQPCAFCALLASRGIAYKSEKHAAFQAHNDCGCSAAPAFTRDHELPSISVEADQVYRDRNKILRELGKNPKDYTALQAYRIAWAHHQSA